MCLTITQPTCADLLLFIVITSEQDHHTLLLSHPPLSVVVCLTDLSYQEPSAAPGLDTSGTSVRIYLKLNSHLAGKE